MRRFIAALSIIILSMIGLAGSASATSAEKWPKLPAAADISKGSSCTAGGHEINVSANFNNTSGSPSVGYFDYAVVSSTTALDMSTSTPTSEWYGYGSDGSIKTHGPALSAPWVRQGTSTNPYKYRADPDASGVHRVVFYPRTSGGSTCTASVYSSN